jgi:hypothetical protein
MNQTNLLAVYVVAYFFFQGGSGGGSAFVVVRKLVNEKPTDINHSLYWYSVFSYMFWHFKMPSSGSQTQTIILPVTKYSFHSSLGTCLGLIMFDSLMMAF